MQADNVLAHDCILWGKSAASSTHISGIGQALEPQKSWKYGQKKVQSHGTCTFYRVWPGRGAPNLSHACPVGKVSLETWQKEKRDPNDADDAGQGGQHHQHHWGSVSPFLASHAPNDPSLSFLTRNSLGASGLVFKMARAHDAHFEGSWDSKNASKILPCRGDSLLERVRILERSRERVQEGPVEKWRSDDARASGVGAPGATPCRGKPLGGTGSALDHGGVAGFKGLRPGAGNAGSTFSRVPSQNTQNDHIWPKPRFSGPEPGFGPDEAIFGCFGGFTPNVTTSGPNPWFWAQNHGPDVVIFSVTPPGASQEPS